MSITSYLTGNFPTYTFYLTYRIGMIDYAAFVFPLNFNESSLIDECENDKIFYRRMFSGSLLFINNSSGNDFDLLYAIETGSPCIKIYLSIEKDGDYYWEGYFFTTDGKFDIDNCTFEVTPLTNDDYALILDEADTQYNILDATGIMTTHVIGSFTETYTHNRWLAKIGSNSVLEFLANKIKPAVNVSSDFFNDTPDNYVTLNSNRITLLSIAQKADIMYPLSVTPATTAMMSWNELMDILWTMFQVVWDYDSATNTINVEHISWSGFVPPPGIDLRSQLSTQAMNKYSYLKNEMPKAEKFTFMEADDKNFIGIPIYYDSPCVNHDIKSNILEKSINVTTDIEYIHNNPDAISPDGFVVLCNYLDTLYYVENQQGEYLLTDFKPNMRLSWANLHNAYFRHNRVLIGGYLNGNLINFWSAQKTKQQVCNAIICDLSSYDPAEEITTELGEIYFLGEKARVQKSVIKPSGEINFNLIYGPEDNINTGIVDPKYIKFIQDGPDTVHAYLSEPSDGNYSLHIWEDMYDSCVFSCSEGQSADPEAWLINIGERISTFTFADLCHAVNPAGGWTIEINIDVSTMIGWNSSFDRDPLYNYGDLCP